MSLSSKWKQCQDKYKLTSLIGSGSFGQVVQAKHRASGTKVAIKLIENVFDDEYDA